MLEVDRLTIRFGGLTAVNDVSFQVGQDEVVGLIGPNGAGKTTLFNAISGLAWPSSGSIRFNRQDIRRVPQHRRARLGIGRTFQIPQPMHELTVRQNLLVAQRFGTGRMDMRAIDDLLELMNLRDKAECQAARELALTELKSLEVAKALATEPKLLLLDEVLAGFEVKGKAQFMNLLRGLQKSRGVSILIIEHDIETIVKLCDRVCVLNFGQLIANGEPTAVFKLPEVIQSYTGEARDA